MDSTSFTFLATILILILLSASLVLRSYILRRRYRRHFQQTLTDAVFVGGTLGSQFDPLGLRRPTRRLGPKPVLWDIWIHLVDDDTWSSFTVRGPICSTRAVLILCDRMAASRPFSTASCCTMHHFTSLDIDIISTIHNRPGTTGEPTCFLLSLPYHESIFSLFPTTTALDRVPRASQCPITTPVHTHVP